MLMSGERESGGEKKKRETWREGKKSRETNI
jgi:hypothetical protein